MSPFDRLIPQTKIPTAPVTLRCITCALTFVGAPWHNQCNVCYHPNTTTPSIIKRLITGKHGNGK